MPISLRAAGGFASGTTVAIPAGTVVGDRMVLSVGCKPYNATIVTPSGWTPVTGTDGANGTVASALDAGSVLWKQFVRDFQAGDASSTITITGANVQLAIISSFQKGANESWSAAVGAKGSDTTSGTGFSLTMDANPGVIPSDIVVHAAWIAGDNSTLSVPTFTATGAAFSVATLNTASTNAGNDLAAAASYALCTSGAASAAPVAGWTLSVAQTGGGACVRLRSVPESSLAEVIGSSTDTVNAVITYPYVPPFVATDLIGTAADRIQRRRFVSLISEFSPSPENKSETTGITDIVSAVLFPAPSANKDYALVGTPVNGPHARRFVVMFDPALPGVSEYATLTDTVNATVAGAPERSVNVALVGAGPQAIAHGRRLVLLFDEGPAKTAFIIETTAAVDSATGKSTASGHNIDLVGSANEDELSLRRFVMILAAPLGFVSVDIVEVATAINAQSATTPVQNGTVSEITTPLDVPAATMGVPRSELTTATDLPNATVVRLASLAESTQPLDVASTGALAATANMPEIVAVIDAASVVLVAGATLAESTTPLDTVNGAIGSVIAEVTTPQDTPAAGKATATGIAESMGISDAVSATYGVAGVAEVTTAIDTPVGRLTTATGVTESTTPQDLAVSSSSGAPGVNEVAVIADSQSARWAGTAPVAESTTAVATQSATAVMSASVAEVTNAVDARQGVLGVPRAESMVATDTFGATLSSPSAVAETITATATQNAIAFTAGSVAEVTTAIDASSPLSTVGGVGVAEVTSATDIISVSVVLAPSVLEFAIPVDTYTVKNVYENVHVAEIVSMTEVVAVSSGGEFGITESASVLDSQSALVDYRASVAEVTVAVDSSSYKITGSLVHCAEVTKAVDDSGSSSVGSARWYKVNKEDRTFRADKVSY